MSAKKSTSGTLPSLQELVDAGAHFGHRRSRSHPKARRYVYTIRDRVLVINLEDTQAKLEAAAVAAEALAAEGCQFLFVGTKPQARETVEKAAAKAGMPSVTHRWLGGTLTNYQTIRASLDKLAHLDDVMARPEFEEFTKKERGRISKERDKLAKIFGGIRTMTALPGALIIVDVSEENIAVAEANRLGIPIIAIVDTNADPTTVTHPIPANDDSRRTIELILNLITDSIIAGAARAPKHVVTETSGQKQGTSGQKLAPMSAAGPDGVPAAPAGLNVLPNAPAMPIDDSATGSTAERLAQALGGPADAEVSIQQSVSSDDTVPETAEKPLATKSTKKPSIAKKKTQTKKSTK